MTRLCRLLNRRPSTPIRSEPRPPERSAGAPLVAPGVVEPAACLLICLAAFALAVAVAVVVR